MCVVSMVGDHYKDKWNPPSWPNTFPSIPFPIDDKYRYRPLRPTTFPYLSSDNTEPFVGVSLKEFNELKKQVEEMIVLLKRAQKYDADNNEPECEVDEKMDLLRKVAKLVGVDLDKEIKIKQPGSQRKK